MSELTSLAGQLNSISGGMRQIGVDIGPLQMAAGALQLVGGMGEAVKGLIAAKQAYNTMRAAEGAAQLAKWGPYAIAVGAAATAGGVLMGQMIERAVSVPDTDAGMRMMAGGQSYGR